MLQAVKSGKSVDLGNTWIVRDDNHVKVYLFNNLIADFDFENCDLHVYTWYKSATTKSRLNVILREFTAKSIYQSDYIWYYSDKTYTNHSRTFCNVLDVPVWVKSN
jgi:hypothetical protein